MSKAPLIWAEELAAPLAWSQGQAISRHQYLADVQALAARLPPQGPMLNLTGDRYRFAVGLGAALVRGQHNLLPPNHTVDMVARLRDGFAHTYCMRDREHLESAGDLPVPSVLYAEEHAPLPSDQTPNVPRIPHDALAAQVLTSGSTGSPVPHSKHWGLLHQNIYAEAQELARAMGRHDLIGVNLVATVPAQHMYGFESTVLVALLAGAAFDAARPFYPADIAAALKRMPRPCILVTTPFHLKMLLESGVSVPAIDLVVCATAPLSPQLAARAEAAFGAPLLEIYGCTEAGQVGTRRTTAGAEWRTFEGLQISGNGDASSVSGGHVAQATALADVLEVLDTRTFRLLGRSNDLINIAGKRSSLGHLNYHLNSISGVQDGAFFIPTNSDVDGPESVIRPVAFVVAPGISTVQLQSSIINALRERVDAAFLPRRVIAVDSLPREPSTGKLPAAPYAQWAQQVLAQRKAASATTD
jgi:acyl-coenzyme A synthetase/AMP-(fatty) acid ligase